MRKIWMVMAVAGLMLGGCGKTATDVETVPEPVPAGTPSDDNPSGQSASTMPHESGEMAGMDHESGEMAGMDHDAAVPEGTDKADICPIEHTKITGKTAFADYNGRRFYFCCKGCPKEFLEHPDQVIAENPEWAGKWSESIPNS